MNKSQFKAWFQDKLSEFLDEEDPRYHKRQEVVKRQEEMREQLRSQIRYYSFSQTSEEVLGNMKTLIILIAVLCTGLLWLI